MKLCLIFGGIVLSGSFSIAQPQNDDCTSAVILPFATTATEAILVEGDTHGATVDNAIEAECDVLPEQGDIWFLFSTPDMLPPLIALYAVFGTESSDVAALRFALYTSCIQSAGACVLRRAGDAEPVRIESGCLSPSTTYFVRVWATEGSGPGTFRLGVAGIEPAERIFWKETFGDGLDGWITYGTCGADTDSSDNARWRYFPEAHFGMGSFTPGFQLSSPSSCDGMAGVDADYNDNRGGAINPDGTINNDTLATGPCPVLQYGNPSHYTLISPAIATDNWNARGISMTWVQGIRNFDSRYFIGYRVHAHGVWNPWNNVEVNTEYPVDETRAHVADAQRVFLRGAQTGDSLQVRFVYIANYYFWCIDDVALIETEAHNLRLEKGNATRPLPVLSVVGQGTPWYPQVDVFNSGTESQTGVIVQVIIEDQSGDLVYNAGLDLGSVPADTSIIDAQSVFQISVDLPEAPGQYRITYTITSDSIASDFDQGDNTIRFDARVDQNVFACESGPTGTLAGAPVNWEDEAPHSFLFGNYFHTPEGSVRKFVSGTFGLGNLDELEGIPIHFVLFHWLDGFADEICQPGERTLIGSAEYIPETGAGGDDGDSILTLTFDNVQGTGPILLEDNGSYILAIQWNSPGDHVNLEVLVSDTIDYGQIIAQYAQRDRAHFGGMLAIPEDGILENADIQTRTYADKARHRSIVPVARMHTDVVISVQDPLPDGLHVELFPNPAYERLNVRCDFNLTEVGLRILGVDGKQFAIHEVHDSQNMKVELDISDLSSGTYLLHIITQAGQRHIPFVVHR